MEATESMQADYSMLMPFLVSALLENRKRYEKLAGSMSADELAEKHPHAAGYLRPVAGYRLFGQREELCRRLTEEVRKNREWLVESLPLSAGMTVVSAGRDYNEVRRSI